MTRRRCGLPPAVGRLVVTDRMSVLRDGIVCLRRAAPDRLRALAAGAEVVNCVLDRRNAWLAAELIGRPLPPPAEECPQDARHILLLPSLILLTYL